MLYSVTIIELFIQFVNVNFLFIFVITLSKPPYSTTLSIYFLYSIHNKNPESQIKLPAFGDYFIIFINYLFVIVTL